MIWQWLAAGISTVTAPLRNALPTFAPPFSASEPTALATNFGQNLAYVNFFMPMYEVMQMLTWVVTYLLPAIVVYTIANWIWRHIPEIWGFGPGAG